MAPTTKDALAEQPGWMFPPPDHHKKLLRIPTFNSKREQNLWESRAALESGHRVVIQRNAVMDLFRASIRDPGFVPQMDSNHFFDTCNKSVAVYLIPSKPNISLSLIAQVLHNYIYRRWFKPFQSDLEDERFICKFICARDCDAGTQPSDPTIQAIVNLNKAICSQVDSTHRELHCQPVSDQRRLSPWDIDRRFYILQPLFRALFIIVSFQGYNYEDSRTVGKIPVTLVRTGTEKALSAPITFYALGSMGNTVETILEKAIDCIIGLEAREATAHGLQPDPAFAWHNSKELEQQRQRLLADGSAIYPSSRFVDPNRVRSWVGLGAEMDGWVMAGWEATFFRSQARQLGITEWPLRTSG